LPKLTCDDAIFRRESFTGDSPVRSDSRLIATPRTFRLEERKTPQDLASPVAPRSFHARFPFPAWAGDAAPKNIASTSEPELFDPHAR
jgi:hypothetical protein